MTNEKNGLGFDKLNNANYSSWAFQMMNYLMKENCYDSIETRKAAAEWDADMKRMDKKAWNLINLGVETSQHIHVKSTKGGREAWLKLKEFHVQTSLSARIRVMKNLFRVTLKNGQSMEDHLQYIFEHFSELDEIGYGLKNDMAVSIVLASLNNDYDPLITALEAWDESRLTLNAVRAKLLEEWRRKNRVSEAEPTSENALRVFDRLGKDNRPRCNYCKRRGHLEKNCRIKAADLASHSEENSTEQANYAHVAFSARVQTAKPGILSAKKKKGNRVCYICGDKGHVMDFCPQKPSVKSEINCIKRPIKTENKEVSAKMARWSKMYSNVSYEGNNFQGWIIDSGASNHICCDKGLFSDLKRGVFGEITVANGEKVFAKGKGTVKLLIDCPEGKLETELLNVLYVPEIKSNLISVMKVAEKGFSVNFSGISCFLVGKFGKRTIGKREDGAYKLLSVKSVCAIAENSKFCVHEWHDILAHRNLADVKKMTRYGINFAKCSCSDICDACIRGKMSRLPFPKLSENAKLPLECVVSDVCGPFHVESLGKAKYYATFIDVYSGYTEVEFLRTRDEVPDKVINFIEKMKTQLGKKIHVFRSDRAAEYLGEKLQTYLKKEGIIMQCTVARSSQQNGIAERKNRTLTEAARTLLISSGLSNRLWAEAVHHANDVFNCIPSGKGKTPMELLFNRQPNINFHEFGSTVYVLNTNQKRKLHEKAQAMKYLGNDKMSKGFRVYSPSGKVIVTRDVKFVREKSNSKVIVTSEKSEEDEHQKFGEKNFQKFKDEDLNDDDENESVISISSSPQNEESDEINSDFQTPTGANQGHQSHQQQTVDLETPVRSRPKRQVQKPNRLNYFVSQNKMNELEPSSYHEATQSPQKDQWIKAMNEELNSINENQTWEITDLPSGRKAIGSKWVFKIKRNEIGEIAQFKARLVAQGFTQKYGVDYDEVFAPVARPATLRSLLSFSGKEKYAVKQYDVKTAFLNGVLEEEIYLKQPPGFKIDDRVFRLKKSLYGLKQAAKVWNDTLNLELGKIGFKQCETDKCLFVLCEQNELCYLLVHVDDMLLASKSEKFIETTAEKIGKCFQIKSLGNIKHYLGIDVLRDGFGHFMICQTPYIDKIIKTAGLIDAKLSKFPLDPGYFKIIDENFLPNNSDYRKYIGMLLYLAVHSRPDIAASVSILSQKIVKPTFTDLNEVKRIIRYLIGTKSHVLSLSQHSKNPNLIVFSDANWAEERETRKSNSGYFCSVNGGAISWSCRRQDIVSLSSTEAEFIALSEACKETLWLKKLLKFFANEEISTKVNVDNQSCLKMIANDKFSNRTKHIDTKFYFTKDLVSSGKIQLQYVSTENNLADIFTKPLQSTRIKYLRELIGLIEPVSSLRDGVESVNVTTMLQNIK
jgi:hypothetical protein